MKWLKDLILEYLKLGFCKVHIEFFKWLTKLIIFILLIKYLKLYITT